MVEISKVENLLDDMRVGDESIIRELTSKILIRTRRTWEK
jgi:hypothetical protein